MNRHSIYFPTCIYQVLLYIFQLYNLSQCRMFYFQLKNTTELSQNMKSIRQVLDSCQYGLSILECSMDLSLTLLLRLLSVFHNMKFVTGYQQHYTGPRQEIHQPHRPGGCNQWLRGSSKGNYVLPAYRSQARRLYHNSHVMFMQCCTFAAWFAT